MEHTTLEQNVSESDGQLLHIQGAIESLLFVNERPVTLDQIKKVLESVSATDIRGAIVDLQRDYDKRKSGMMIIEIAGGYQMLSNPAYASYLRSFYKTKHKERLSKPALESMAIIAYKQPVTRSDIELIRGVNSDGVIAHLLNKELIKAVGRKDVPGRPYLYGTTKQFLEYFGLKSLDDLPALEEFPALQPPEDNGAADDARRQEAGPIGVDEKEEKGDRVGSGAPEDAAAEAVQETKGHALENEPEEPA